MTYDERQMLRGALERIPCELTVVTYMSSNLGNKGAAWLGCKECARCLTLQAFDSADLVGHIRERVMPKPLNGGYELRKDLRK